MRTFQLNASAVIRIKSLSMSLRYISRTVASANILTECFSYHQLLSGQNWKVFTNIWTEPFKTPTKSFSDFKLVNKDLLSTYAEANWDATENNRQNCSLAPGSCMGEEERESGTHCLSMHQVPLVTYTLLRYMKITINFCLLAKRPHCRVILTYGSFVFWISLWC